MINVTKKILKAVVIAGACLAILYMAGIYIWGASYTVLSGDDFSHGKSLDMYQAFILWHILGSLLFMLITFYTWQGTYFAMFIEALLNPVNGYLYPQLKIVMVLNTVLIILSLLFLLYELFQNVSAKNRYLMPVVGAITLFALYGFNVYHEVFFWYSGAASYGFPFSVMIAGIAFNLRHFRLRQKKDATRSKIFGLLACGGTLMISGAGCYFALLILIYSYLKDKTVDKESRKIFRWWLISALVNTLAPGNYFRKMASGSGISVLSSLKNSIMICLRNYRDLVKTDGLVQFFLLFLVIGIIIGLSTDRTEEKEHHLPLLLVAIISPIASWVSAFPAVLGYGAVYGLGSRCNFIINSVFIISVTFAAIVMGYTLARKARILCFVMIPLCLLITLMLSFFLPGITAFNKYSELQKQLVNGEIQGYYNECKEFNDKISAYPEDADVVVSKDEIPVSVPNTHSFYDFSDESIELANPDNWMNSSYATFCKVKSFAVEK